MDTITIELNDLVWAEVAAIFDIACAGAKAICATTGKDTRWNVALNADESFPYGSEREELDRVTLSLRKMKDSTEKLAKSHATE